MIIKIKPFFLRLITGHRQWVAFTPCVYHPWGIDPQQYPEVIAHEAVHLARQEALGRWLWYLRYCVSPSFRVDEEVLAIVAQLEALPESRHFSVVNYYANALSGRLYWWATSYAAATAAIEAGYRNRNRSAA